MARRTLQRLVLGVAAAAAALAVAVAADVPGVRLLVAVVLVILLPGFAVAAALLPSGLDAAERATVALGLGLVVPILCALVLNTVWHIGRWQWVAALAVVTAAATAAAVRRSRRVRRRARAGWSSPLPRLDRRAWRIAGPALAALVLAASAIALARTPLPAAHADGYTLFWAQRPASGAAVRVGIRSFEHASVRYRLLLRVGGRPARVVATLRLDPFDRRQVTLSARPGWNASRLELLLYRTGDRIPYRRVDLAPAPRG